MQSGVSKAFFAGQARLLMFGPQLSERIECMQQRRQVIGWTGENDVFQGRVASYGTRDGIEIIQHDEHTRTAVRHLVLHLTLSIQRIGGYDHRSRSQCAIKSNRVLWDIG